jgi:hypothetical protein
MDVAEIEYKDMNLFHLAWDGVRWWNSVNTVMNLWLP